MQEMPAYAAPVHRGPRAYRHRIRGLGPILGLLPPAALGVLSLLLLRGNTASTARGVLGFLAAVLAAPGLLVAGAPLTSGSSVYLVAGAGSLTIWLWLSTLASRRATRSPVATWADFWREYLWLAGGVWLGTVGALVAANLMLGGAFL